MHGSDLSIPGAATAGTAASLPSRRGPRWVAWLIAGLLAAYACLSFGAATKKGVSFDEGLQLALGYNIWLNGDYRYDGANGDFIRRWATLPFLVTRPNFPASDELVWRDTDSYGMGRMLLFEQGNRPESLLRQARAMVVLLGVVLGLLLFWCGRNLFGTMGGLVSLGIFCFSPHQIAFGGIVSTDLSITLFLLASTCCIWRLLHRVTIGWVLASAACFGLLLLAKMTALMIFPIAAVLVAIRLIKRQPMALHWVSKKWILTARRQQAVAIMALVLVHAVAGWTILWAHYGFRYSSMPPMRGPGVGWSGSVTFEGYDLAPGPVAHFLGWSRRTHFLPESYLNGVQLLLAVNGRLQAFMDGEMKLGGWRGFFPYAIWVKTHPSLFAFLGLSLLGASYKMWGGKSAGVSDREPGAQPSLLYRATPYVVLVVVYLTVAIAQNVNLGHRHILPIYPALDVLAGATTLLWARWRAWGPAVTIALIGWRAVDAVRTFPHYLAYFGPQAGGSERGYQLLVDSSLDWGMNLPGLKEWLDDHNPGDREPLFLAYFGTDSPDYYGIKSQRLPGFFDWRPQTPYALRPGYYAISATLLQGLYLVAYGPWNVAYEKTYQEKQASVQKIEAAGGDPAKLAELFKIAPQEFWEREYRYYDHYRFARLCAWLRVNRPPEDDVGHAIFIWKLSQKDIEDALLGPPTELEAAPLATPPTAKPEV